MLNALLELFYMYWSEKKNIYEMYRKCCFLVRK